MSKLHRIHPCPSYLFLTKRSHLNGTSRTQFTKRASICREGRTRTEAQQVKAAKDAESVRLRSPTQTALPVQRLLVGGERSRFPAFSFVRLLYGLSGNVVHEGHQSQLHSSHKVFHFMKSITSFFLFHSCGEKPILLWIPY